MVNCTWGDAETLKPLDEEMAWLLVSVHPSAKVAVTLYVPLALTSIDCVVAPVDQLSDVAPLLSAVSVTEPVQKFVAPDGWISSSSSVTVKGSDVRWQPSG